MLSVVQVEKVVNEKCPTAGNCGRCGASPARDRDEPGACHRPARACAGAPAHVLRGADARQSGAHRRGLCGQRVLQGPVQRGAGPRPDRGDLPPHVRAAGRPPFRGARLGSAGQRGVPDLGLPVRDAPDGTGRAVHPRRLAPAAGHRRQGRLPPRLLGPGRGAV